MSFFQGAINEHACVSLCDDCYQDAQEMYTVTICTAGECICDQVAPVVASCDRCRLLAGCPAHHLTQVLVSETK